MEEKLLVPHSDQGQIPPEDLLSTSQEYLGDCLCKASCSSEFALFKKNSFIFSAGTSELQLEALELLSRTWVLIFLEFPSRVVSPAVTVEEIKVDRARFLAWFWF